MSRVALPADRRFHRAYVKPARRRGRVRMALWPVAKYGLALAVVAVVFFEGLSALSGAAVLRIRDISVRGNARMSAAKIQSVVGGLRGQNIVMADLERWRGELLLSPWVRDAAFRRSLPSTVEVVVSEREPMGIGRSHGRLFLVDERGRMIDDYGPQYADFDLPIIDGLNPSNEADSEDEARGALAARLIQSLKVKPAIAKRLSQIDVTNVHNATVIIDRDAALIYVGEDRFLTKLESYLGLSGALRERVSDIDYVDLRFDDRIFVRPVTRAKLTATPVSGQVRATRASTKKR